MNYLFTSESVSEGHPDKVADQISDALLDQILAFDANSKVAIETLVTTGQVVVAGEVKSQAYVDVQEITRNVINQIGYTKAAYRFDGDSCGVLTAIHEQSDAAWTASLAEVAIQIVFLARFAELTKLYIGPIAQLVRARA